MNYYYVTSKNIPSELYLKIIEKDLSKLRYSIDGEFCIVETSERIEQFNPMTLEEIKIELDNENWNNAIA